MNRREVLGIAAGTAGAMLIGDEASAQQAPAVVTAPPVDFSLPTTAGRDRMLSQLRGKVVVLFYETRGTITQNQHVKDAMGVRFNRDRALANRITLIAACNVAEYNSWPSQYFAREAISAVARSQRIELWLDWNRTLIQRLGLRDGASNIVIVDRTGVVRERHAGRLADPQVGTFLDRVIAMGDEGRVAAAS
jgi:hypothetical protein